MKIFRGLNSRETLSLLEFINNRPIPPDSYKVMFVGDSLTLHGTLRGAWDVASGMAASSPEKDFVHLVVAGIQKTTDSPVEALYNNGGNGKIRDMLEYLQVKRFDPDLVIIQGGENDKLESLREHYPQLLDHFSCPRIVLGDWYSKEKSDYSEGLCRSRNLPFVSLYDIASDKRSSGWGGPYSRKDVASHPNDFGHAAIAQAVLSKVEIGVCV